MLVVVIVLYPLVFIWQGLDFTDTGFAAANYQEIFRDPASISYWGFNYWLTDVIGGLWLLLFHPMGLLGLRLAAVLTIYVTNWAVYRTLRPYVGSWQLLFGLLFAECFIERMYWLNYDNLTAMFLTLASVCLLRGLARGHWHWFWLAGFVAGLNTFIRIPNVLDFLLVHGVGYAQCVDPQPWRKRFGQAAGFLAGFIFAVLATLAVMAALGQLTLFGQTISNLFHIASRSGGDTHAGSSLWRMFVADHAAAGLSLLLLLSVIAGLTLVLRALDPLRRPPVQWSLAGFAAVLLFALRFRILEDRYHFVVSVTGVLYGALVLCMIRHGRRQPILSAAAFISLLDTLIAPLGSDLGMRLAGYGMYLGIPVALDGIAQLGRTASDHLSNTGSANEVGRKPSDTPRRLRIGLSPAEWRWFTTVLGVLVLLFAADTGWHYTYRDASNRLRMLYPVHAPELRGILTTQERAQVVQQLVDVLPRYVHSGDELIAAENIPMVYYLAHARPYLYTSWPDLYQPDQFSAALARAAHEHRGLPVVIRAKGATDYNWPNVHTLRHNYRYDEDRAILNRFLREHHYRLAWQNRFFVILVPPGFRPS